MADTAEGLKYLVANSELQAAAVSVVAVSADVRAVWPLISINVWGREQLRVLVLTDTHLFRVRVQGDNVKLCETTSLSQLQFVVKGYLCYPRRSLINALDGGERSRTYAFRLYSSDGPEPHRTYRAMEISDELGMRSTIVQVIEELAAAAKSVKNTGFFISDHDITLSAWLGPFAYFSNRVRPALHSAASFSSAASTSSPDVKEAPKEKEATDEQPLQPELTPQPEQSADADAGADAAGAAVS